MKVKILTVLICMAFFGCISPGNKKYGHYDDIPSIQTYQVNAKKYERDDELQLALANWRIAEKLMIEKINAITEHIGNNAEKHFQTGITFYNAGFFKQAQIEFLKTLRYDREHKGAYNHLKNWHRASRTLKYTVREGDTFHKIADSVYNDYNKEYIVRYFSALSNNEELKTGYVINLPVLNVELTKLFFNFQKEMVYARKLYHNEEFEMLLPVTKNILKHVPANKEATFMKNTSCYKLGEKYFHAGKFQHALDLLKRVDSRYRNVKSDIAEVKSAYVKMKKEASEYESYKFYYKGLELYKNKKYFEALENLSKIDSGYADVEDIIRKIKLSMRHESDLHYKNGVKFYINEELHLAINEWEKALVLNPAKKKIKRDIDNAMNLLEKIKQMD